MRDQLSIDPYGKPRVAIMNFALHPAIMPGDELAASGLRLLNRILSR
jgi:hypothetical protein